MTEGTPIDIEKLRSIQVMGKRSRPSVVEGKEHPETGRAFKSTTDELGNTVTEHSAPGAAPGVSDRQDVNIRPQVVRASIGVNG